MNSLYNIANSQEFEIGVSVDPAAKAALFKSAAFCFVAPFLVAHSRSRKALQLLLRRVTGTPTRLGYLPDWRRSGSRLSTDPSEANMAPITPPRVTSDTAKPTLTQERLKELLHYDPDTGVFLWATRPARSKVVVGSIAGCKSGNDYLVIQVDGRLYLSHRLAWLYVHGLFPDLDVDHMDGVRSNNRIANLRLASKKANAHNVRRAHADSTSGILGVWKNKGRNKWTSAIKFDGKIHRIGSFETSKEAQEAYLKAKREFHEGCLI